eukprot:CAMPEP_0174364090 /NCGR_PEP_ID=MMETSP0811_2-20130205/71477_1 /TAXON_ID=73025 ORGANISM="Eutreptiella gymnastica-like, Strain CCMP1594" /NCGR_SAMPLE_ID=MMETSP0811_2 /ASSEMBLY_ACC=CAM_ASM_000667 /LENGTH=71 /DNA_ID=CAMNT_0015503419 /DNA_START=444 /DNA_END=659 /DNA_ORIENTATION=+
MKTSFRTLPDHLGYEVDDMRETTRNTALAAEPQQGLKHAQGFSGVGQHLPNVLGPGERDESPQKEADLRFP